MPGFEFCTKTRRIQPLVIRLVAQMTQVQFCGALMRAGMILQYGSALAWAVIEYQLVISPSTRLTGVHGLGFNAGKGSRVGMACLFTGEPGRSIAGSHACALAELIRLGVCLPLAIVKTADDDWAVDIAFHEIHQYFLPHAGKGMAAPICSCYRR